MSRTTRPRLALVLLAVGQLLIALDFTIVYVALPEIARSVGFSPHDLQWVVTSYGIAFGGFLLLGGRLADMAGRRRMFVAGMLGFGVASLLGGLATGPATLLAARVLQGISAAALFPATLSLVTTTFAEGPERNRALSVWAMAGAAGLTLGALLGGVLTDLFGWEGVFLVNVPVAVLGAAGALALVRRDAAGDRRGALDLPGALTATAGVTLLVLAIAQAPERGVGDSLVLGAAAGAVVLLAAFFAIEARSADPLLPLRMLAVRRLRAAAGVIFVFGMGLQVVPYFLTLYFQDVLDYSALEGGLAFLGPTLAITAGNVLSDRLVARTGTRVTLVTGMLVGAAGAALLAAQLGPGATYATTLAGVVVAGLGMGLVYPAMFLAASEGVVAHEQGIASGIASTALQIGAGAGLAVLVGVAGVPDGLTGEPLRVAVSDGLTSALLVAGAISLLGAAAAYALPHPSDGQAEKARAEAQPAGT